MNANDNTPLTDQARLLAELALCNGRICEDVLKAMSIARELVELSWRDKK